MPFENRRSLVSEVSSVVVVVVEVVVEVGASVEALSESDLLAMLQFP
jgi:hypothetical protein